MTTTLAEPSESTPAVSAARARAGSGWLEAAVVLAVAGVAAIVVTWPLVTELGSVVHDGLDPLLLTWIIDWVQHAIGSSPLHVFDANIFAPQPDTLAYSDSLLGIAIPFLPFRWLGASPIAQLNLAVIIGSAVTAASGYLVGRVMTGSRVVAAVAGAAFAFGPIGTVHMGHIQTVWRAGIALAVAMTWMLADRSEQNRPLWPPALGLFAALAWQSSISFYPGAHSFVAVAVVLLVRWRSFNRRSALAVAITLAASLGAVVLLAIPYLANASRLDDFDSHTLTTLNGYHIDFFTTDPRLSIWGPILGAGNGWPVYGKTMSFPGATLLVLSPIGLVTGWRDARFRRATVAATALVVTGLVLGIGASDHGWRRFTPYRVLHDVVPGWGALRAADRTWFIGLLGLGVLGGLGALAIARWLGRSRPRVVAGVVAVIAVGAFVVEGYAPWTGLVKERMPKVDTYLASLPGDGGVVYLPSNSSGTDILDYSFWVQPFYMYESTAHHRRMPNGFSGYTPKSYARIFKRLLPLPAESALDTLRAIGMRYVVVHGDIAEGTAWEHLLDPAQARPLRLVKRFGTDLLYEVPPRRAG